jgi:hypothetical protein
VSAIFGQHFHAHIFDIPQLSSRVSSRPEEPGSSTPSNTPEPTNILDHPDEVLSLIFSFVDPLEAVKHLPRVHCAPGFVRKEESQKICMFMV